MASGFTDSETFAQIPDSFFRHLLIEIDDLDELKVTLFALWRIGKMESRAHYLRSQDFAACVPDPGPALEKAVSHRSRVPEKDPSALFSEFAARAGCRGLFRPGPMAAGCHGFPACAAGTSEHIQAV
jgi:hypothetical protein